MKKSRFLAFLLVAALMLTLGSTAFATDTAMPVTTPGTATIEINGELKLPKISVTIAPPAGLIINPYQMSASINVTGGGTVTKNDSVFSTPSLITNSSDIDMTITAKPTATTSESVTLLSKSSEVDHTSTQKAIYLAMHMANADSDTIASYDGANVPSTFENTTYTVLTKQTNTAPCSIKIPKGTDADSDGTISATESSFGVYLIKGESVGTGWGSADTIGLKLIFDIQPTALVPVNP